MGRGVWVTAHLETGRLLQGRGNLPWGWGWGEGDYGGTEVGSQEKPERCLAEGQGANVPTGGTILAVEHNVDTWRDTAMENPTQGWLWEAILLWGACLALVQGKGTVTTLLLEVWLILT